MSDDTMLTPYVNETPITHGPLRGRSVAEVQAYRDGFAAATRFFLGELASVEGRVKLRDQTMRTPT